MYALRCLLLLAIGCGRLQFDPLATDDAAISADSMTAACGSYVVGHVPSFTTSSRTFVDIPGGSIALPSTGDPWLLFVSAGLRSSSTVLHSIEVQLRVEGARRVNAENQNAQNKAMPWLHADVIPASARTVDVQVRDLDGTATIENLKIVAYRIPMNFDGVITESSPVQIVGTSYTSVLSASINPTTTADYLVLVVGTASEEPSMSDISLLVDDGGMFWPLPSSGTSGFANGRGTWRSVLWARRVTLSPGPQTFTLKAAASTSSGSVRDLKIMILRGDQIGLTGTQDLNVVDAQTSSPVIMSTHSIPPSATSQDVVTLQVLTAAGGADMTGTNPIVVDFTRDGVSRAHYENFEETGSPILPYGFTDAFTQTAGTTLANQFQIGDPARLVSGKESAIIVLSRTCP